MLLLLLMRIEHDLARFPYSLAIGGRAAGLPKPLPELNESDPSVFRQRRCHEDRRRHTCEAQEGGYQKQQQQQQHGGDDDDDDDDDDDKDNDRVVSIDNDGNDHDDHDGNDRQR